MSQSISFESVSSGDWQNRTEKVKQKKKKKTKKKTKHFVKFKKIKAIFYESEID